METKVLEIENLKEQNKELQDENFLLTLENADLKLQIARLRDKLEFASEQADTFAKALVKVCDFLENKIDDVENGNFIKPSELTQLKNSIPENALKRSE